MTKKEGIDQDKSLNRLQWLIQRSKVGFKGNPPPFESLKTQKSVELEKKKASSRVAGDGEFLPFRHGAPSLAEDARPTKHLRGVDNSRFERRADLQEVNYYCQRIDNYTGRPEIESALCWDLKGEVAAAGEVQGSCRHRLGGSWHAVEREHDSRGVRNPYLATLSPAQRAAIVRADILSHPKFTGVSREFRAGEAWYGGTQLEGQLHLKPTRASLPSTRNCIRVHAGWR
ncbi:hypothetical protein TraAM80_07520 [Trypanosoma rangeli]|uniref:Uncharacterized protein n=1 Tax=Trypanosoma rangeli TaxID=5698 RepID=A0A3R7MDP5_TRYRA|nr:uncharacterized protein TraAM80_07520 [Trypanosoma rangeli]RNF00673.1 hypothetical protein TraAM80_07520 [Trypanosoma rangeli]|eukprot:RNF00673.1 hypothetical protein TraAM80_07520 [Trypanosoma rangeli]